MKRLILDDLRKMEKCKTQKTADYKRSKTGRQDLGAKGVRKEFPDGFAYFNFDKEEEYKQFLQRQRTLIAF